MKNKDIIKLLQAAYAAELETVANYLANSIWLDGLRAEEIKESLDEDVAEELGHAKQLAQRIKILGGKPPGSLDLPRTQKSLQPPKDSTDMRSVIEGVIEAEEGAIEGYKKLIKACDGVDYVTQDLAVGILADEEEHRSLFLGFLKSLEKS
jgi:bacterioferritin